MYMSCANRVPEFALALWNPVKVSDRRLDGF